MSRLHSSAGATDSLAVLGFIEAAGCQRSTEEARDLALTWFRQNLAADLPEDATTAARSSTASRSRRFLSALQTEGENAAWACWLEDSQPASVSSSMIIEAGIWSSGNRVERFGFRLLADAPSVRPQNGIADKIQALCGLYATVTETSPAFEFVRSESQVRKLAAHLLDRQRKRAAIVLSTRRDAGTPRATELDANAVANGTCGLASVYVIASDWTRDLANRIGRGLAVFDGSVRVYLPGLQKNRNSRHHPVYLRDSKPTAEAREQAWQDLQHFVAEQSREVYGSGRSRLPHATVESELIAFRRTLDSARARHRSLLERIGTRLGTGIASARRSVIDARLALAGTIRRIRVPTKTESLRSELEAVKHKLRESEQGRRKLVGQLSQVRQEAGSLRAKNETLKERLRKEVAKAEDRARLLGRHQLPTAWTDIPGWCEQQFNGKLMLHPTIRGGLPRAQYEDLHAVARGLSWLAEEYRAGRLDGCGGDLRGAIPDGQGVHNERCGSDSFEVDWQGRRHPVEWHLRKGDRRDPKHCLRIYYFWDPALKQVVVADMPAHRN